MSVDSPQSPEESINAKHSSICQSKRTQSVFKKTSGHEAQQDINNPCFQKIKIRKSLRWNIKWHWVEYSMLVLFDSFNDFFAILCSVIRKVLQRRKNCPMMIAISVGFARHALKKLSEIPVPLHHWRMVETTLLKTSRMSQWFSRQMKGISIQGSLISDSSTETVFLFPLREGVSTAASFRGCSGFWAHYIVGAALLPR